ncbi:Flp pilus assembly protein CpaB [Thalassoglobus sp.]|uniref:Flp pilus assembly protein CpaB n=1 Tax=Thalassoglobus sp. TaxID=2795869 RepID=UPI003AA98221
MRRLSPALLTMVMLGVVGLLVAMYFAKNMFATEDPVDPDPIRNIPMALTDLPPGTKITSEHIGTGRARSSSVTPETVISDRILLGRIVKDAISAAKPISSSSLYPPNEGPPLELAPGTRAVTVNFDGSSSGTIDLLKAGQYVDVLFSPSDLPNFDQSGGLIMTLFKGVKIIAINGVTIGSSRGGRGGEKVTLELTPEQANILLLTEEKGKLDLTYTGEGKGSGVVGVDDENRATLNQILGLTPPEDPEKQTAFTTEVFNGTGRQLRSFVDGKLTDRYLIEQQDFNSDDLRNNRQGQWSRGRATADASSVNDADNRQDNNDRSQGLNGDSVDSANRGQDVSGRSF